MCAQLLTLYWTDGKGQSQSELVGLEDIAATGACVRLEQPIPADTPVSLHYPSGKYEGKVKYCLIDEIGYFLGISFNDGCRWSKDDFQPAHILEIQDGNDPSDRP
jgi:hypothetical protein